MFHHSILPEVIDLIQILAWPTVVIVVFLYLKDSISILISRIQRIAYKDSGIEMAQASKQGEQDSSTLENLRSNNQIVAIDKILDAFSPETKNEVSTIVDREAGLDSNQNSEQREKILLSYSQLLNVVVSFNRIYYLIFGSQIRILQRLNCSVFESKDSLKPFYEFAKAAFPRVYAEYPYENYLAYMKNAKLIDEQGKQIIITPIGKDFLKFLIDSNLSYEKLY